MSTTTMERPTRQLMLPPANVRACEVRPPQWWDVGHARNRDAIALCGACPFRSGCKPATRKPVGQIIGGIAYGERSNPLPICDTCHNPITIGFRRDGSGVLRCNSCRDHAVSTHQELIETLRAAGRSFAYIGGQCGVSGETIRHWWNRHHSDQAVAA
ncbi:hypothetical protein [Micromonospora sp. NPDC005113]